MSYNLSLESIELVKTNLDELLSGQEVEFYSLHPQELAYHLRQAVAAAKDKEVHPYAELQYKFRCIHRRVIAVPKKRWEAQSTTRKPSMWPDAVTELDVASAVDRNKLVSEFHFPNFAGNLAAVIERWAPRRGLTVTTDPYLILTRDVKP